jgi:hypothetical protein
MRHLFLISSMMFLVIAGCNSQTKERKYNKAISLNDLNSLPTEAEWKAAALPTEDEWKKAAAFDKNLNTNKKCPEDNF